MVGITGVEAGTTMIPMSLTYPLPWLRRTGARRIVGIIDRSMVTVGRRSRGEERKSSLGTLLSGDMIGTGVGMKVTTGGVTNGMDDD
jgi:TRAP-type uncharacterized transport system fused permease subunit